MLCDECKKRNAIVHMSKIIQGKKEELHLCEACAKNLEISGIHNTFSIPNFLVNILEGNLAGPTGWHHEETQCPKCGTTVRKFNEIGVLGCHECYETLHDKLKPLLKRIHGNTIHLGKVPKRTGGEIHLKRQLDALRQKLKRAIEMEAFEDAAVLRDEIRKVEEGISKL